MIAKKRNKIRKNLLLRFYALPQKQWNVWANCTYVDSNEFNDARQKHAIDKINESKQILQFVIHYQSIFLNSKIITDGIVYEHESIYGNLLDALI